MGMTRERLDSITTRIVEAMQASAGVEVHNREGVAHVIRAVIAQNLREEAEIEKEAQQMLQAHGQAIYEGNADYNKLLTEGKKILAKKRGFTL